MKKLLFINDTPLDHFILKKILNQYKLDYEVNCTANGEEVLVFLKQNKNDSNSLPDIVLFDIYMPQIDGWALLEKLNLLYPSLAKPVGIYILSSSINPADIQRSKRYSFVKSFIFKPITKEMLEKLINDEVNDAS